MSDIEILISDRRGIYIPQDFAAIIRSSEGSGSWQGYTEEDLVALEAGPSTEGYWDTWDNVLGRVTFKDSRGNVWHLTQDGDLFLYCDRLMTDKEYEDFYGYQRLEKIEWDI